MEKLKISPEEKHLQNTHQNHRVAQQTERVLASQRVTARDLSFVGKKVKCK